MLFTIMHGEKFHNYCYASNESITSHGIVKQDRTVLHEDMQMVTATQGPSLGLSTENMHEKKTNKPLQDEQNSKHSR